MSKIASPSLGEYHEFYQTYINYSQDKDALEFIEKQRSEFLAFLKSVPEDRHNFSYAPGKWTLKQLIRHIIDAERIFSYRALAIARNDKSSLPGMDQDEYQDAVDDSHISFQDLIIEFDLLRQSNVAMFKNLSIESYTNMGVASDCDVSVRALLFIILGHLEHHRHIISERYIEHV